MQNSIPYVSPQQVNRPSSRIVPGFEHIYLNVEAFFSFWHRLSICFSVNFSSLFLWHLVDNVSTQGYAVYLYTRRHLLQTKKLKKTDRLCIVISQTNSGLLYLNSDIGCKYKTYDIHIFHWLFLPCSSTTVIQA